MDLKIKNPSEVTVKLLQAIYANQEALKRLLIKVHSNGNQEEMERLDAFYDHAFEEEHDAIFNLIFEEHGVVGGLGDKKQE